MGNQKYKSILYPIAENDLLEIKDYFQNKLKISHIHLFQKIFNSIELLESNPYIHPLVQDSYLNRLGYRIIPVDNYLIFYVLKDTTIQIHRILYGRRNYVDILGNAIKQ